MAIHLPKNPEVPASSYRQSVFKPELLANNDQLIEGVKADLDQDCLTCQSKIKLKDPAEKSIQLSTGAICAAEFLRDTMLRLEMIQQRQPEVLRALYHRVHDPKSVMTDQQKIFAEAWRMGETTDLPKKKLTLGSIWPGFGPFEFPSKSRATRPPERISFCLSANRGRVLLAALRLIDDQIVLVNPLGGISSQC